MLCSFSKKRDVSSFTTLVSVAKVSCQGTFQVLVQKFTLSSCSSSSTDAPRSLLYFWVCLSNFKVSSTTRDCTFGEQYSSTLPQTDESTNTSYYRVNIDFNFAWPGSYSLVIEAKCSNSNETLLKVDRNEHLLSPSDQWARYSYESSGNSFRLDYSLRVVCAGNLYGPSCSTYCKDRDDVHGHFRCSANGTRVCNEGWADPENYCKTAICRNNCNHGNGSCEAPNQCRCYPGWSGLFCDVCQPAMGCDAEHGTCQLPGECNCREGWGGLYCRSDLQFCTNNMPCRNGGTCFNTGPDGFVCQCPPGFNGTTCLTQLLDCSTEPCLNGATCMVNEVGYECNCPSGYTGDRCQSEIDECQSNPCRNGGSCIGDRNGFHCVCSAGFSGKDCGEDLSDGCSSSPCRNSGTCLVDRGNVYRCLCAPDFTGSHCEKDATITGQSPNATSNGTGATMTSPSTGPQLVVIICLGVLIPIVVIATMVVIWLVVRKLRRQESSSSSAAADCTSSDNIRNDIKILNNALRPVTYKVPPGCPVNFKVTNLADDCVSGDKVAHAQDVSAPSSLDKKKYSDASFKQLNWTAKFETSESNDLNSTYKESIYCIDKSLERYSVGTKTYSKDEIRTSPHRFHHSYGESSFERYINDSNSKAEPAAAAAAASSSSTESIYRTPCSTSPGYQRNDLEHQHQSQAMHNALHSTLV